MMCPACFKKEKIKTLTTFTVEIENGLIVVRHVPCLECPMCGDTTFTDDVAERLERIVNAAKTVLQEISVIDYEKVA